MIESVEGLSAELEACLFAECKLLIQAQIPVLEAGIVEHVARTSYVVEGSRRRSAEQQFAARVGGLEPILRFTGAIERDVVNDRWISVFHPELSTAVEAAVLANAGI